LQHGFIAGKGAEILRHRKKSVTPRRRELPLPRSFEQVLAFKIRASAKALLRRRSAGHGFFRAGRWRL
jgi:hypothetical protein